MVVIRCSFTALVNEEVEQKTSGNATLTLEEFWSVLVAKSRNLLDYVPEFSDCKVVRERKDAEGHLVDLTRRLRVKGFEQEFEKVVTFKRPMMLTFDNQDVAAGSYITNVVSADVQDPNKIYMTCTYEFRRPGLQEGSADYGKAESWYRAFGKETVSHVVSLARELKKEGRLPVERN